jgi:hypothetical protein
MSDGPILRNGRGVFGEGFETTPPDALFFHPGELGDRLDDLTVAGGLAEDAADILLERWSRENRIERIESRWVAAILVAFEVGDQGAQVLDQIFPVVPLRPLDSTALFQDAESVGMLGVDLDLLRHPPGVRQLVGIFLGLAGCAQLATGDHVALLAIHFPPAAPGGFP